jgi:hypothetical protein
MWRQGVIEMRSRPPMLVWIISRGVPIAPSWMRARPSRWMGSRRKFSAIERTLPALRLLALDVQPGLQASDRDRVVVAGLDGDVGGLEVGHLAHHGLEVGEDLRAGAEQLLGLIGVQLGLLLLEVAAGDQLHVALAALVERGRAAQVAPPHPAAANRGVLDPCYHPAPP